MMTWAQVLCLGLVCITMLHDVPVASATDAERIARGRDVFAAAGGCGCHSTPEGGLNAGGRKFTGVYGTVYATNITPDHETGIGTWTEAQFGQAMRYGMLPNGNRLLPVMPYPAFRLMAEDDMRALWAYLRSVPAINQTNPPRRLRVPFVNAFLALWSKAYGGTGEPPAQAPTSGVARGAYLVRHVAHCGECHTPRRFTGGLDTTRLLAGTAHGPEGALVPNITPDVDTGIGDWSDAELVDYLQTGFTPEGDNAQGLMEEVIEGTSVGYKDLSTADLQAIVDYLRTVPPVVNKVSKQGAS